MLVVFSTEIGRSCAHCDSAVSLIRCLHLLGTIQPHVLEGGFVEVIWTKMRTRSLPLKPGASTVPSSCRVSLPELVWHSHFSNPEVASLIASSEELKKLDSLLLGRSLCLLPAHT